MKGLGVTKTVKDFKFEGVWNELKAKNCFQRLYAKFSFGFMYLLTAPFVRNSHNWAKITLSFKKCS